LQPGDHGADDHGKAERPGWDGEDALGANEVVALPRPQERGPSRPGDDGADGSAGEKEDRVEECDRPLAVA
jgi:hypothetical protein